MAVEFNEVKIGGLDCIEVPGQNPKATVILLHGYGATNMDLVPLSRVNLDCRWIFPAAPEEIVFGPDYTGYAWFPVDVPSIRAATQKGEFEKVTTALEKDLAGASHRVQQFLSDSRIPANQIILGGFSQGAVVAIDCALALSHQIKALLILSGTVAHEKRWQEAALQHAGLPFFMGHGEEDEVLPVDLAKRLEQLLVAGGLKGKLTVFKGGHEIPLSLLLDLQPFLSSVVS